MRILLMAIILMSCEAKEGGTSSTSEDRTPKQSECSSPVSFTGTYNYNGYDYEAKEIDMLLPENYQDDVYKSYGANYTLTRDDGEEVLTIQKSSSLKYDCENESRIAWVLPSSGKTRDSLIELTNDLITICVREENEFREYEQVCHDFRSI